MAEHEWEDKGGGGLDGAEITAARCKACGVWGVQIAEYDSGIVRFISSADPQQCEVAPPPAASGNGLVLM